jgi:hypothetical protein
MLDNHFPLASRERVFGKRGKYLSIRMLAGRLCSEAISNEF